MRAITFILPCGSQTTRPDVKDEDSAHFVATFNRAMRLSGGSNVLACEVHMGERTAPQQIGEQTIPGGWLEHTIVVRYNDRPSFTVGAIQRTVGVESEFHS